MSDIVWVNCETFPSHDDTFSTQVRVVHDQGTDGYLIRQEDVDQQRKLVRVSVETTNGDKATVRLSTKYPTSSITLAHSRLVFEQELLAYEEAALKAGRTPPSGWNKRQGYSSVDVSAIRVLDSPSSGPNDPVSGCPAQLPGEASSR